VGEAVDVDEPHVVCSNGEGSGETSMASLGRLVPVVSIESSGARGEGGDSRDFPPERVKETLLDCV